MDTRLPKFKKKLALKNINKKNYFQFDASIESQKDGIFTDYVFITIGEYSGNKTRITMQIRLFDFSALRYGLKELITLEKANLPYQIDKHFSKVTEGSKKTLLHLGYTKNEHDTNNIKYFINLKNDDNAISTNFDKYEIRALLDSMDNFIKFSENKYFNHIYMSTGK